MVSLGLITVYFQRYTCICNMKTTWVESTLELSGIHMPLLYGYPVANTIYHGHTVTIFHPYGQNTHIEGIWFP